MFVKKKRNIGSRQEKRERERVFDGNRNGGGVIREEDPAGFLRSVWTPLSRGWMTGSRSLFIIIVFNFFKILNISIAACSNLISLVR